MKLLLAFICLCIPTIAFGGVIHEMLLNNPDQFATIIKKGTYRDVLDLIQTTDTEAKAGAGDEVAAYGVSLILAQASIDKQISLAIDFCLAIDQRKHWEQGARLIAHALLNGATPSLVQKQQAAAKLKEALALLPRGQSQEALDFAMTAADTLMILGDDAGLDIYLTDVSIVGSSMNEDSWQPASSESTFIGLQKKYEHLAQTEENSKFSYQVSSACYKLCASRRAANKEAKPLSPILKLDSLRPEIKESAF